MFIFADIAAKAERLAKGDPALDRETMLHNGAPEDQHVTPNSTVRWRRSSASRAAPWLPLFPTAEPRGHRQPPAG
jgi:hypothetical protein